MRRTTILSRGRVNKTRLRAFLISEGVDVELLEEDDYELQPCRMCGRLLLHPVVVDGRVYGDVCARKMETARSRIARMW